MSSRSVLRSVINPKPPTVATVSVSSPAPSEPPAERPTINEVEDMELITTALVENAPVAMAMFDRDLRYVLANRQWITDFGLKHALPIVGRSQFDVFPNLHPGWRSVYDRALQGHVVRSEHDVQAGPEGRGMVFRWEVRPWRRAQDASVMGIMVTCEKFKGAMLGVAEGASSDVQQAVMRAVLPEFGLPVLMLDESGVIRESNAAFCGALGQFAEDLNGVAASDVLAAGVAGRVAVQAELSAAMAELAAGDNRALNVQPDLLVGSAAGFAWTVCRASGAHPEAVAMLVGTPRSVEPVTAVASVQPQNTAVSAATAVTSSVDGNLQRQMAEMTQELADLRELEAAYRRREQRHREVLDTMPCGLIVLDEMGRPIFQNAHVRDLVGRELATGGSVEQWLSEACSDGEAKDEVARTWREDVWRRQLSKVISLNTADGLVKDLEFRPSSLPQGGLLLTIHDVSESCRLEEMLHAVEAKFRTLLRECPVPLLLTDVTGSVFDANGAAESLLGRSRNELRRGRIDEWLNLDSAERRRAQVRIAADNKSHQVTVDVLLHNAAGDFVEAGLTVGIIPGADGRPHALAHYFLPKVESQVSPEAEETSVAVVASLSEPPAVPKAATEIRTEWSTLLTTDSLGRVISWDDAVGLPLMGLTSEVMIGRWLHQLFRPSDATGFYGDLQQALLSSGGVHTWAWFGGEDRRGETSFKLESLPEGCSAVEMKVEVQREVTITSDVTQAIVGSAVPLDVQAEQKVFVISPGPAELWMGEDVKRERMLLTETHHRVKNHLQIISSLLNLQSNSTDDEVTRGLLRSSQNRVRAIAALHQHLFQMQLGQSLDLGDFAEELVQRLRECYDISEDRVSVELDVRAIRVRDEWLMPLALIMNEALSNCFKHAFPDGRHGLVKVTLAAEADGAHLRVEDNGVGLPEEFGMTKPAGGLGLKVLGVFSDQMRGRTSLKNIVNSGLFFDLLFPITCVDI